MLPVAKMKLPSALKGQRNGLIQAKLLKSCGLGKFVLLEPAARSFKALAADAQAAGFPVWTTGTYRSLSAQVNLFTSRYTNSKVKGAPAVWWNNRRWWKRPGVAQAAKPGTSNHGWGLAVDLCLKDGKTVLSVTPQFVNWLCRNAADYGWSAELQSEPWHWRAVHGDTIPAKVLKYEEENNGSNR
jgi:zinc D-Ala-D-Ala carboxypeptidase